MQKILSDAQIIKFHHQNFVDSQVNDFVNLIDLNSYRKPLTVLDIGGGCGFFLKSLSEKMPIVSRLIDLDENSVNKARQLGVYAEVADVLDYNPNEDEDVVCFNLILHHLVASSDVKTKRLQEESINIWKSQNVNVFINEYIYESYLYDISGRLIYLITSSKILSFFAKAVSIFIPSLRANTFGVGVRFRSSNEWRSIFTDNGWEIVAHKIGNKETVSIPLRFLLLIREIRRDSFLLKPINNKL